MQLIGQENNLDIINNWDTLPQFILITGDRHTGKTFLTLYLCRKFNLHYTLMKNGVNDVRNLIQNMKPFSNTLYHFKDFHTASLSAKNALLKITEEPLVGNYIVITGSSQLKTLESRARKLVIAPYTQEQILQYMTKYFDKEKVRQNLYKAGFNTPAKVEMYKNYGEIESLLNFAVTIFNKLTYLTVDDIIVIVNSFETKYENVLDVSLLFLTMLINLIEYNLITDSYYSYYDILKILIEGKETLEKEPVLNRKFLLFKIFYKIYETGVIK